MDKPCCHKLGEPATKRRGRNAGASVQKRLSSNGLRISRIRLHVGCWSNAAAPGPTESGQLHAMPAHTQSARPSEQVLSRAVLTRQPRTGRDQRVGKACFRKLCRRSSSDGNDIVPPFWADRTELPCSPASIGQSMHLNALLSSLNDASLDQRLLLYCGESSYRMR